MTRQAQAQLRLVGGAFGGRRLRAARSIRPTQERVREALFSRWAPTVEGCVFLDLFCGSGAMGLEAVSRGAARAVLVDAAPASLAAARANAEALGVEAQCRFVRAELPDQWSAVGRHVDGDASHWIVFADPPYDFSAYGELAARMLGVGAAETVLEHSARMDLGDAQVEGIEVRTYGETAISFLS